MREFQSFRPLYDPTAVQPMRDELMAVGIDELTSAQAVDEAFAATFTEPGKTALVVVNSVCGCAAGNARPGVMLALQNKVIPDRLFTVFAGQDREATERAREKMEGIAPSSPCIAVFKDGKVATILERHRIEGRGPEEIATDLVACFNEICSRPGPSISPEELAKIAPQRLCGQSIPRFGE